MEWISVLVNAIIVLIGGLLLGYQKSYFKEKGKNLATKEDIEEITKKVEEVKSFYSQQLESQKFQNQLKLTALDKRLEKHQKAYGSCQFLSAKS